MLAVGSLEESHSLHFTTLAEILFKQSNKIIVVLINLYVQNLILATAVMVVQLSDVDEVQKHNEFTSCGHSLLEPEQL